MTEQIPDFVKGDYIVNLRDITVEWSHCDPADPKKLRGGAVPDEVVAKLRRAR
jgi:hypothetical protein